MPVTPLATLRSALKSLRRRVQVAEVPPALAACEFCCREPECSAERWVDCERRLCHMAARLGEERARADVA